MRNLPEECVEAATVDSWAALNRLPDGSQNPLRDYGLVMKNEPGFIEAHRKMVRALLETGCDPAKAIPRAMDNKFTIDTVFDTTKAHVQRLALYLKEWAHKKGMG